MMYGMVLFVNMKIIGMHAAICNRVVLVWGGGEGCSFNPDFTQANMLIVKNKVSNDFVICMEN